jgi:tetratricopeptide (TPR) repeat protein
VSIYPSKPTFPRTVVWFLAALFLPLPCFAGEASTALLIEQGHYKRAQAILSERLKANPNDARSLCEMSQVSLAFMHWDDAIQRAEKSRSFDGKNADFQAAVADAVLAKLSLAPGGMFEKMSLARRFRKEAELALQLDPKNVMANSDLMQFYLGAPGLVGGSTSKATDLADRMVRLNAVRGYVLKSQIASHEKRVSEAEQFLQQAVNADLNDYMARLRLAGFYLEKGGTTLAQAEEPARQEIRIDPGRADGYSALAALYAQQGRWKDLDSLLADSQRAVPDNLAPLYQAAEAILTNNDTQELPRAEKLLRTYLSQPAEGNEPTVAMAHWRLGLVLEKEGRKDQARQELQQAVSLDPAFEPARKDLKRLK